jgi:hypothetical protein
MVIQRYSRTAFLSILNIFNMILVKRVDSINLKNDSPDVVFKTNATKCFMFTDSCYIEFLLNKSINISHLTFESSNQNLFSFKSIVKTSINKTKVIFMDFKEINHFNKSIDQMDSMYDFYEIQIKTGIIGKEFLVISSKFEEIKLKHQIIIQTKIRTIDK